MAFTSNEFRIETGYGQTIKIRLTGVPGLIAMETEQENWEEDGERVSSIDSVECVLDITTAQRIAIALYQACKAADPKGTLD